MLMTRSTIYISIYLDTHILEQGVDRLPKQEIQFSIAFLGEYFFER